MSDKIKLIAALVVMSSIFSPAETNSALEGSSSSLTGDSASGRDLASLPGDSASGRDLASLPGDPEKTIVRYSPNADTLEIIRKAMVSLRFADDIPDSQKPKKDTKPVKTLSILLSSIILTPEEQKQKEELERQEKIFKMPIKFHLMDYGLWAALYTFAESDLKDYGVKRTKRHYINEIRLSFLYETSRADLPNINTFRDLLVYMKTMRRSLIIDDPRIDISRTELRDPNNTERSIMLCDISETMGLEKFVLQIADKKRGEIVIEGEKGVIEDNKVVNPKQQ